MPAERPVVVLGAGPAGIGAGIGLGDRGLVLEAGLRPGGLCRTIELDGAVFDWGGHSFHTPHPEIHDLIFETVEMYSQRREARCFTHGTLIPYPFQAHFAEVPDPVVVRECADGLRRADGGDQAANFEEYIQRRFGTGIAHHFMLPYNRKLWGDLRRLSADWSGERVAAPLGLAERFAESGGRRKPLREDTQVAYPARGGFEEILAALAQRLPRLRLGQRVVRIDPLRRQLATASGEIVFWNRLISTLPLPLLLTLLRDTPPRILRMARRLEALPLALVLVVVGHPVDTSVQRVYCPGPEIPAHKVAINHNSSPYLRSLPHHGILAEVAMPAGRAAPPKGLRRRVVRGLVRLGLIRSPAEVRTVRVVRVPRAYPVPTLDRDRIVGELKDWLKDRSIHCAGRFGEWAYINSDEALHRGLMLGRRLAGSAARLAG